MVFHFVFCILVSDLSYGSEFFLFVETNSIRLKSVQWGKKYFQFSAGFLAFANGTLSKDKIVFVANQKNKYSANKINKKGRQKPRHNVFYNLKSSHLALCYLTQYSTGWERRYFKYPFFFFSSDDAHT